MAFKTSYNVGLGQQAFDLKSVDVFAKNAVGTIVRAFDDLLGEAEFMYLPGVAGLLAGDHVVYDLLPGAPTVTRSSIAGNANSGQGSAIAQQAIPAGSFGWFQISGVAVANVVAGTVAGRAFLSATAGSLSSTASNGAQLIGARLSSAVGTPVAGQAYLTLCRPSIQSQVV